MSVTDHTTNVHPPLNAVWLWFSTTGSTGPIRPGKQSNERLGDWSWDTESIKKTLSKIKLRLWVNCSVSTHLVVPTKFHFLDRNLSSCVWGSASFQWSRFFWNATVTPFTSETIGPVKICIHYNRSWKFSLQKQPQSLKIENKPIIHIYCTDHEMW